MTAKNIAIENYACPHCRAVFRTAFQRCPLDGNPLEPLVGDPLSGSSFADRYIIEECVGEGGMGRVYRARHQRMSRLFAIKVLFGDHAADSKMQARLAREAEAASRLSHPNVISVLDFGETEEGLLYLVMDYVAGPTLAQLIGREAPFDHHRILKLTRDMARGLSHAHKRNLIHRDFKADNVIISTDGGDRSEETAKIVDFGIAVLNEPNQSRKLTTEGMVLGTPAVMAPEQAVGEDVDHRTDLFSLGVVMYEMLCGHLPFDGTPLEIARQNLINTPPRIAVRVPGLMVDRELEALSLTLMNKRREDRPSSAKEVLLTLSRIEGESSREFRRSEGAFLKDAGLDPLTPVPGPMGYHDPSGPHSYGGTNPAGERSQPGFARPASHAIGLTEPSPVNSLRRGRAAIILPLAALALLSVVALTVALSMRSDEPPALETEPVAAVAFDAAPTGDEIAEPDATSGTAIGLTETSTPPLVPVVDDDVIIDDDSGGTATTDDDARARQRRREKARAEREAKAARAEASAKARASERAAADKEAKEKAAKEKAAKERAAREAARAADDDLEEKIISVSDFNGKFKSVGRLVNRAKNIDAKASGSASKLYSQAQSLFARAQRNDGTRKQANSWLDAARRKARKVIKDAAAPPAKGD